MLSSTNLAQVDFQQLRIKHILFKSKVRSVVYGGNFDEEFFSAAGPISQWFATVGQPKYGREPEVRELQMLHQELNSLALQLHSLYAKGKIDQAHDGLKQVDLKSEQFQALVARLEARFGGR